MTLRKCYRLIKEGIINLINPGYQRTAANNRTEEEKKKSREEYDAVENYFIISCRKIRTIDRRLQEESNSPRYVDYLKQRREDLVEKLGPEVHRMNNIALEALMI
jgi:hypothetical protein